MGRRGHGSAALPGGVGTVRATGAATGHRGRSRAALVGGSCGLAAGLCWVVKGAAVLVTGHQPPLVFEVAPLLMAVAVWGLARQLPPSRLRTACAAAGVLGATAAVPVVADGAISLPTAVTGPGMAVAHTAVLVGLAAAGLDLRRRGGGALPLVLAAVTVPAVAAGGALMALAGERALEVPIVALGSCWVVLGVGLLRQGRVPPSWSEPRPFAGPRAAA